ncbi:MAG: TRAP transporter substrate-binding protein [Bdellovibrionales bacterium]|nr:TRAP transporter substrate-binding protein [Bdellovibrionales bacterium]
MSRRHLLKNAGLGALALSAPAVAVAKPEYKIKMATTWLKNYPGFGTSANELGKMIEQLSGGRIKVKVYGAKEIVPAMQLFDAVQQGTVEMGHGASYYWQGKIPSAPFFATIPFGFTAPEMNAWLEFGGGKELWAEAYAPFGVKPYSVGNSGTQMGGWFNKEIKTLNDFKGLKIRMPGLGGKVLSELGAAVVTMSGGEVFQALKSGNIDAAEWVCPYNDSASGLHKAAKFYYWPGWHEPGSNIEMIVNKKFFESLPKDLQRVIEVATQAINYRLTAEYTYRNAPALEMLEKKHKVKLMKFPDEVLKGLQKKSQEVVLAVAKADKHAMKTYESMEKFRGQVLNWQKISEIGYSNARGF